MNFRTFASFLLAISLPLCSRSVSAEPADLDPAPKGARIADEPHSTAFAERRIVGELIRSMDSSRLRLTLGDTGSETRQQQDKIMEILGSLIKQAEDRESSSRDRGSTGQAQMQGPPTESHTQAQAEGGQTGASGGGSKGTDKDQVQRLRREEPRSPWSQLRDKDRDPVYSAIKERFPARYQQLLEQYYKSFQDD